MNSLESASIFQKNRKRCLYLSLLPVVTGIFLFLYGMDFESGSKKWSEVHQLPVFVGFGAMAFGIIHLIFSFRCPVCKKIPTDKSGGGINPNPQSCPYCGARLVV